MIAPHKPEKSRLMNRLIPLLNIAMLILALAMTSTQTFAANIVTSVDRNPVNADESFKIFFTATDTPDSEPDFSPLEQDFSILNQSQSSSSSWVNGAYSKSIRWTLEVTANKAGNLLIPEIQFGNDISTPLAIVVNTPSSGSNEVAKTDEDIFLDVNVTPKQPFVQSQVIYTLRVYSRVSISQASLSEPELADAVVEKIGEDSNYNTVENGVSYVVTERKYAIFPQKSGEMKIKPLVLNAEVIVNRQPDFNDFFGSRMTKTKRVLSKEVTLNVKPKPSTFTGKDWLAAEKLEFTQEWSGDTQQMKIGEPITRTLTLKGEGTTVGQLPELNTIKTDANLKAYPDQPVLNEQKSANGISASRQEKIALIPEHAGNHVLPAIEIPWFNTLSQKMEIARLPETTITVIGGAHDQAVTTQPKAKQSPTSPTIAAEKGIGANTNPQGSPGSIWFWTSLFLAFGWLLTIIYFLRKKTSNDQDKEEKTHKQQKHEARLKGSIRKLKDACTQDNALSAKNALLEWGKDKFNANNLGAIAQHCDARLRDEILQLNQTLYGKTTNQWNGKRFMQAFIENNARATIAHTEEPILEPLHRL